MHGSAATALLLPWLRPVSKAAMMRAGPPSRPAPKAALRRVEPSAAHVEGAYRAGGPQPPALTPGLSQSAPLPVPDALAMPDLELGGSYQPVPPWCCPPWRQRPVPAVHSGCGSPSGGGPAEVHPRPVGGLVPGVASELALCSKAGSPTTSCLRPVPKASLLRGRGARSASSSSGQAARDDTCGPHCPPVHPARAAKKAGVQRASEVQHVYKITAD